MKSGLWVRFFRRPGAVAGLVLLAVLVTSALLAPMLAPHDPLVIPVGQSRLPSSATHWLGTDQDGRDVLARLLYGARTSLLVGFGSMLLAVLLGVCTGALAGYRGGWVDAIVMRFSDLLLAFPSLLLAGSLVLALGNGIPTLVMAIGFAAWPLVARVARASVIEAKQAGHVLAARIIGCSPLRTLVVHVLPHAMGPVLTVATLLVGTGVLAEAALSFLNVGVHDPTPSWGLMIASGQSFLATAPQLVLFPAVALFVTVLAVVLVAEGFRAATRQNNP